MFKINSLKRKQRTPEYFAKIIVQKNDRFSHEEILDGLNRMYTWPRKMKIGHSMVQKDQVYSVSLTMSRINDVIRSTLRDISGDPEYGFKFGSRGNIAIGLDAGVRYHQVYNNVEIGNAAAAPVVPRRFIRRGDVRPVNARVDFAGEVMDEELAERMRLEMAAIEAQQARINPYAVPVNVPQVRYAIPNQFNYVDPFGVEDEDFVEDEEV